MQDTPDSESAPALAPEATIIPEAPPPSPSSHTRSRLARAARLLVLFTTGQATVQLLNVAAGLILIRVLSKEAYAQFTLGNTVLNVLGGLIEFGFAPAIMALVGERIHDRLLLGKFVRSATVFRDRLLIAIGPGAVIALVVLGLRQEWPLTVLLPMGILVLGSAFVQGRNAYYTIPLRMHHRVNDIYTPQVFGVLGKIASFVGLWALGLLGAVAAMGIHFLTTAIISRFQRRRAIVYYEPVKKPDPEYNSRMLHHLAPMIPMHLFAVFQGNILVVLVTILGSSDNIAEIGALGRLAQLFLFVTTLHGMLVIPWIARTPRARLLRRYLFAAGYPVLIAACIVSMAFAFPKPILWLLGPGYSHLHQEVSWMVMAGGIHYIGGALFHIHFSRRWLYWWGTVAQIIGVLSVQAIGVLILDLSQTMEAVFFAVITNTGLLVVSIAVGFYGFRYGPRGGDSA
jgi:hypothetical protein